MELFPLAVLGFLLAFNSEFCYAQDSITGSPEENGQSSSLSSSANNPDFWGWLNSQDRMYPLKSIGWILGQMQKEGIDMGRPLFITFMKLLLYAVVTILDSFRMGPLADAFNSILTPLWKNVVKVVFIISAFISGYFFKSLYKGEYYPLQEYFVKFVRDLPNLGS